MTKKIDAPALRRDGGALPIEVRKADGEPIRLSFSASSEAEVERWFGREVLVHESGALRDDRLKRGAVPLLFNHDWNDPIGMVDAGAMRDRRLMVDAHLFATERAREVAAMVEGGLRNVSIGYQLHELELSAARGNDETYRATDWELLEVSIVTVPADPSIGIGRTADAESRPVRIRTIPAASAAARSHGETMSETQNAAAGAIAEPQAGAAGVSPTMQGAPSAQAGTGITFASGQIGARSAADLEAERRKAISQLCRANKLDERIEAHWVQSGASLNTIADDMVKIMAERSKLTPETPAYLGMESSEVRRYSLMRALRASISNDWSKAGLELEAHKAVMSRINKAPRAGNSFFVPMDVQRAIPAAGQRDMTVAGVNGSNYLVSTDNQPGSFVDLLRNRSVALRMGATRLSGLVGNVTIPKRTAASTAYWLADESTQITESNGTFAQISLTAKNVAALTEVSHQLMSQSSPSVEMLVLQDLAEVVALAVDVAILRGSGNSGQPTGIVNTVGIGSVSGSSLAAAGVLEFQSDVAANNALMPGCGYVTTAAVAALLAARPELPSTGTERLWKGNLLDGTLFNFPAMSSQQMSSATMLFGHWPSVILGEWGVLELMTNPYSDFTRGLTGLRAWYTCDVAVRHPGAFSYASSIS